MLTLSLPDAWIRGLSFPESPRWHAGALWFSDFYTHRVCRADDQGRVDTVCELAGQPSGLGWMPDGTLRVVSMRNKRLLAWRDGRLETIADLSPWAGGPCNDMLVDPSGRCWVGNMGFDLTAREPFVPTVLLRIDPQGQVSVAARGVHFPNGTVMTPDGRTLIVAESYGQCLTAWDVGVDGQLSGRRQWAVLSGKGRGPDGICLDAEGAVWLASPVSREVLRVREGGEVTHRIPTPEQPVACMLGGQDRQTLFILTGRVMVTPQEALETRRGAIHRMRVDVPGAGAP